jgi:hypothetical protein
MRAHNTTARGLAWAIALAAGLGVASRAGHAQGQPPLLLVLDSAAVDVGDDEGHMIPSDAGNGAIAAVGLREALPYFTARIGTEITLPAGRDATSGWFAIASTPAAWSSDAASNDGLANFAMAGPGLGSPDDNEDRSSLLTSVPGVAPLGAADFGQLVGRDVCAVVYRDDIAVTTAADGTSSADLSGATLGLVALHVTGVTGDGSPLGAVTVQVLDVHDACGGALSALTVAPQTN